MSKETKEKISDANLVLGTTLAALLAINPANLQVRAQVMAKCVKPIPVELTTYAAIVEWIEQTIPNPYNEQTEPSIPATEAVRIDCTTSSTEHGRCDYSCTTSGRSRISISRNYLMSLARESDDMDELMEKVSEIIEEKVWENDEQVDSNDYDYNDHESNDNTGSEYDYNHDRARDQVISALRQISADEYDRLDS